MQKKELNFSVYFVRGQNHFEKEITITKAHIFSDLTVVIFVFCQKEERNELFMLCTDNDQQNFK